MVTRIIALLFTVSFAYAEPVRLLFPTSDLWLGLEKEMDSLVLEFNQVHPNLKVEVQKVPGNLTTIEELFVRKSASNLPDLAIVDSSDLAAIKEGGILQKIPKDFARKVTKGMSSLLIQQSHNRKSEFESIPFT